MTGDPMGEAGTTGANKPGPDKRKSGRAVVSPGGAVVDAEVVTVTQEPEAGTETATRTTERAAPDQTGLPAGYRAFAEAVIQGQRRNTMLAAGAAGGAVVACLLAGVVYFQSVDDLRVASAVQSEAARLLVEEVRQIDSIGDVVAEQQGVLKADLLATLELVKDEVRRAAMEGTAPAQETEAMDAQIATSIREGVKADLGAFQDEILTALAEVELVVTNGTPTAEMAELLAGVKALVAASSPPATAQAETVRTTSARPAKPQARPQPVEPSPFTYP
jgi:hypothetical protein